MLDEKKMARINELGRKSRVEDLTVEEKEEQRLLREEYLTKFRANFKSQLDNIEIVEEE